MLRLKLTKFTFHLPHAPRFRVKNGQIKGYRSKQLLG